MIKDFIRKNILGFIVIVIFSIITNGGIAVSGILFIRGTDSLIANNFQAALIILAIYLAVEFTSYFLIIIWVSCLIKPFKATIIT